MWDGGGGTDGLPPCAACRAEPTSHSRECMVCGVPLCKRCKKKLMKKAGKKKWACLKHEETEYPTKTVSHGAYAGGMKDGKHHGYGPCQPGYVRDS